jgi:HEAT repeat protein
MPLFGGPPDIEKLKSKRNVKGLAKALRDDDPAIRAQASAAIGELQDLDAVPQVLDAIEGQDEEVMAAGTDALRALGDQGHLALHVYAVHKGVSPEKRVRGVTMLARLGHDDALRDLTTCDYPEVRERAQHELQARGGSA